MLKKIKSQGMLLLSKMDSITSIVNHKVQYSETCEMKIKTVTLKLYFY